MILKHAICFTRNKLTYTFRAFSSTKSIWIKFYTKVSRFPPPNSHFFFFVRTRTYLCKCTRFFFHFPKTFYRAAEPIRYANSDILLNHTFLYRHTFFRFPSSFFPFGITSFEQSDREGGPVVLRNPTKWKRLLCGELIRSSFFSVFPHEPFQRRFICAISCPIWS